MLHRLVHRLKGKLEPAQARPSRPGLAPPARYVQTLPGFGYRLTP